MSVESVSLHFLKDHPKEAARALEEFSSEHLAEYLALQPAPVVAELFRHIIPSVAADCLRRMPLEKSAPVISQMGIDRATLLLRRMKSGLRVQFIRAMSPVFANMARLVLRYPEGTVGRVMNPNVFTVFQEMDTREVLNVIKQSGELFHNVIFVVDNDQRLAGIVDLKQLLVAGPDETMKNMMRPSGDTVPARSSLRMIPRFRDWNVKEYFPVTDHLGSFIGVLQRADVFKNLNLDQAAGRDEEFTGTALALAELFWDACANLLTPDYQRSKKVKDND